ncbi:MAG: hypothetical protein B7Z23_01610 [Pseudomonadales bacterium 32-61-5]|nr:MAG: hypothetical protein B7Z23_01610 [Pseudomonadales bacterium 32-61-5]
MLKRTALSLLCLSLAACQSSNPYTSESAPIPPAPPVEQIQSPIYPATPRDFSSYQSWSWRTPPAAPSGSLGDVQISTSASLQTRVRQVYDDYGSRVGVGRYGGGYGYGSGYGVGGSVPVVRNYEEEVMSVRIEMFDTASGQSVWSNQAESRSAAKQAERKNAAREAINRALADYPPR